MIGLLLVLLYLYVWCVWWRRTANENCAEVSSCNAKCGTSCDCCFGWWINIFTWTIAMEELTTVIISTWKNFTFSCFKKWMKASSINCPDFVSCKWWNLCEWWNWFCFFSKAELSIFIWSTSKDTTFFADIKVVLVCAWQTDNFLIWKFEYFVWFDWWRENTTFWTQNNGLQRR